MVHIGRLEGLEKGEVSTKGIATLGVWNWIDGQSDHFVAIYSKRRIETAQVENVVFLKGRLPLFTLKLFVPDSIGGYSLGVFTNVHKSLSELEDFLVE